MKVPVGPSTVAAWLLAAVAVGFAAAGRLDPETAIGIAAGLVGVNNSMRAWQATRRGS